MLAKGVKRKRGAVESAGASVPAPTPTAAPAASLFSLSVVKLHQSLQRVEPDLRPLVLVANALRRLQDQMQTEAAAPEPPGAVLRCPGALPDCPTGPLDSSDALPGCPMGPLDASGTPLDSSGALPGCPMGPLDASGTPLDSSGALPDCPMGPLDASGTLLDSSDVLPGCPMGPLDASGTPLDSSGALPGCPTGPLDGSSAPLDSSGALPGCPTGPLDTSGTPLDSSGTLPGCPTGPLDGSSAPLDSPGTLPGAGPATLLPSLDVSLCSSISGLLEDLEPAGSLVPALWGAECGARALLAPLPDEGLEDVFEDIDTSMYDSELWAPAGLKALAPAPGKDKAVPGPEDGGPDINDLDLLMDVLVGPRGL